MVKRRAPGNHRLLKQLKGKASKRSSKFKARQLEATPRLTTKGILPNSRVPHKDNTVPTVNFQVTPVLRELSSLLPEATHQLKQVAAPRKHKHNMHMHMDNRRVNLALLLIPSVADIHTLHKALNLTTSRGNIMHSMHRCRVSLRGWVCMIGVRQGLRRLSRLKA